MATTVEEYSIKSVEINFDDGNVFRISQEKVCFLNHSEKSLLIRIFKKFTRGNRVRITEPRIT